MTGWRGAKLKTVDAAWAVLRHGGSVETVKDSVFDLGSS